MEVGTRRRNEKTDEPGGEQGSGHPGADRAQAYADIDVGVMQTAAPMAPIGTIKSRDFFSERIGCQTYSPPFGMSIAALCLR